MRAALDRMERIVLRPIQRSLADAGFRVRITPNGGYNGPSMDAARQKRGLALRPLPNKRTGKRGSAHRTGEALDLQCYKLTSKQLAGRIAWLRARGVIPANTRIIVYPPDRMPGKHVHVDLAYDQVPPQDRYLSASGRYVPFTVKVIAAPPIHIARAEPPPVRPPEVPQTPSPHGRLRRKAMTYYERLRARIRRR